MLERSMSLELANSWEIPIFSTRKFSSVLWPQKPTILTTVHQMCLLSSSLLTTARKELSKRMSLRLRILKRASFVQNLSHLLIKMLDYLTPIFPVLDTFQVFFQRRFSFNVSSVSFSQKKEKGLGLLRNASLSHEHGLSFIEEERFKNK